MSSNKAYVNIALVKAHEEVDKNHLRTLEP